jgi:uncharacterized protein YciI
MEETIKDKEEVKMKRRERKGTVRAVMFSIALLLASASVAQSPSASAIQENRMPNGMKKYFMAFLVKGEKWDQEVPKDELNELMQKHLGYIRSQAAVGKYMLAGPFLDNQRMRGFLIVNAASADEVREIVSGDPMVKSGRMAAEIHPAMMADVACVIKEYNKTNEK